MLVDFIDDMERRGSVPYDEVSTIREDNFGYAIIRCKSGEIILTSEKYVDIKSRYDTVVEEDMEMFNLEDDDEEEL